MSPAHRSRQRGIAVLTAILVVAIATVLAVNLLWMNSVELQRTESLLLQDQARQFDVSGEELAKLQLADEARKNGDQGTVVQQDLDKPIVYEIGAASVTGLLRDEQGRFDLNTLVDGSGKRVTAAAEQYQRLLQVLLGEEPLASATPEALTDATVDWIDPNSYAEAQGAEDDVYTSRPPPQYRPANFWFTSTSELLAVQGYTKELYEALAPHVTALPPLASGGQRRLNVNTATDVVLASLVPGQTPESVKPFVYGAYDSLTEFTDIFPDALKIPPNTLDIRSDWFLLTVTTSIGTTQSTMYSLLERDGQVVRARRRTFDAN